MKLSECANIVEGKLIGRDCQFSGISTDTRHLEAGQLFIALKGPHFDGHDFVKQIEKKAAGVLVEHAIESTLPQVIARNSLMALGKLAHCHRQRFSLPVIALTGSCGKTTTKAMIANILQLAGNVLATQGTKNNFIGVPLTLLELQSQHDYAVVEVGTNRLGEIDYLAKLVTPEVALITNIAPSHLEGLGDIPSVAREKGDIYKRLKSGGLAIMNADELFIDDWKKIVRDKRILTFGIKKLADVMAQQLELGDSGCASFVLVTPQEEVNVTLTLLGRHQVMNALAAASVAFSLGLSADTIKKGLETLQAVDRRMVEYRGYQGAKIIDDTYNANPLSTRAAIEVLAAKAGEKILVMGDMGELGENALEFHKEAGTIALRYGIDSLYACGKLTQAMVESFGERGFYFQKQEELIAALKQKLKQNIVVLVKGSLSMAMKNVVKALVE